MLRTTLRNLAARKLRLLTTSVAVILGVAFMVGTLVLTDTIGRTFDNLFADVNAGTDAYVRGNAEVDGRMGDLRPRLDQSLVATVGSVDGVAAVAPRVQGYTQILDREGEPMGHPNMGAPTYGANWITTSHLNPFRIAEGRAPERSGEMVIDRASATLAGYDVGDTAGFITRTGRHDAIVVGIATFGEADSPGGASFALFTTTVAQELVTERGKVDGIAVAADPGVAQAAVVERIADVLSDDVEVLSGEALTAESRDDLQESLSFFNVFLMTFAFIALFVGSFIIYNTFSILVAQRGKEMALLRALGAGRRQVLTSVLLEALAVGLAASLGGIVVGVGVAGGLKALLAGMGIDIPAGGLVVTGSTVTTSLIAGVVVCVVSAVFPARKASLTPPVAAMRETAFEIARNGRGRVVSGSVLLFLGAFAMLKGLFGGGGVAAVGLGAVLVFVGIAVLAPLLARPITRVLGAPLVRLGGVPGALARENAMRNPKRTATTASALMIGVALVGFITILASSAKASINDAIDSAFTGDFVVDSGTMGFGGFSPDLASRLDALPEVDSATGVRVTTAEINGSSVNLVASDPDGVARNFDFGDITGSLADLGTTAIAVHRAEAEREGLHLGDTVDVTFADTGSQPLTVAAIYEDDDLVGPYFVGLDAYEANVADQLDFQIFVTTADGVRDADARSAIDAVVEDYPQASVQDRAAYKDAQTASIDQMLNLVYELLALAILVALIGIANTLALSIFERTRELGLLRAVGMGRRQLRRAVRGEAALVALLGTVLGLGLATIFGWAVVEALKSEGITALVIPGAHLAVMAVVATGAGVLAAARPARRASRLEILQAVAAA